MVIKRDGRRVPFDGGRIQAAVFSAALNGCGMTCDEAQSLAVKVAKAVQPKPEDITVEEIQDAVVAELRRQHPKVAEEYEAYRKRRERVRRSKSDMVRIMREITAVPAAQSDLARENANINADAPMGAMLKIGSENSKEFYLDNLISPPFADAVRKGFIHIHDLDFFSLTTNCCQIDLADLFTRGFSTGHGSIRPPKDIRAAAALTCIVIQSNQNDQFGGQSIPAFDYALAPYVGRTFVKNATSVFEARGMDEGGVIDLLQTRIDAGQTVLDDSLFEAFGPEVGDALSLAKRWTERDTHQAMEALLHNLNTMHSRAGAQVPFSSINYGTCTTPEAHMLIHQLLRALEEGIGNGETAIFPIHIFKVKDGVNFKPGDPNYDLYLEAIKVTAKRLFPNFEFLDAPFNLQYYKPGDPNSEVATMGCRTRVMSNVYDPTYEKTFGRGNLSFTTLNLPRMAILAKGDTEAFLEMVRSYTKLVFEQLKERLGYQMARHVYNHPFLMGQHVWHGSENLEHDDCVGDVLRHGTLTVGFIGLAEAMKALFGKHHGEDQKVWDFAYGVIKLLREMCDEESVKTKLNFSVIASPAEGLSGKFVRKDAREFGSIEGVTDREYYTNSFHIPVYYHIKASEKIRLEAPFHALCNGGHITYVEVDGDPTRNLEAMKQLIDYMKECGIGYGSINHPVDHDPVCGYTGIIGDVCPRCGRKAGEPISAEAYEALRKRGCLPC